MLLLLVKVLTSPSLIIIMEKRVIITVRYRDTPASVATIKRGHGGAEVREFHRRSARDWGLFLTWMGEGSEQRKDMI